MQHNNNFMQIALELAERGRYSVAPNPLVGCVIERDGIIVGRGWHQKAGSAHAEIEALQDAKENTHGANIYTTLEPCCHYGRTPPCVDRLIASKVKSVHIALIDPNPLVAGRSIEKLKAAGIEVFVGEEENAAREQNEVFLNYIISKKPYIIAKWAMTLDGRIAQDDGEAKWITSETARRHVHYSRSWLGAVLVGCNTILRDDPRLTSYLIENHTAIKAPTRIVLDSCGRIPLNAKIIKALDPEKTIIATTIKSSRFWRSDLSAMGVIVLVLPENKIGQVSLPILLAELYKHEISGILVEGGQKVLTSFFKERLINKVHAYIAPKLIGGNKNFSPLEDCGIPTMADAMQLTYDKFEKLENDFFVSAIPNWRTDVHGNN